MGDFRMPSLGTDMASGTLVEWKVRPGDAVTRGQIVAEVETDKGVVEVEIFESGVVESLLVQPGTKVPVGTALARISGTAGPAPVEAAPAPRVERVRVSPLARRRAQDLGLDPTRIAGTGVGGAVTVADVEAAQAGRPAPGPEPDRNAAMRRAIAAAMSRSKREIPHYYLSSHLDAKPLIRWLSDRNAAVAVTQRMLAAVPLLKAVARALVEVPGFNGVYRDGAFQPSAAVHLGVAIALRQGGLVAPAIHDAANRTLEELMAALTDLIRRVRSGSIRSSELADPTVTVTNLGDQGSDSVLGVIFPPQVAIIGLGRIRERPWVIDGALIAHPVITATLSADHRVSDGHQGARFLATLERLLSEPERL